MDPVETKSSVSIYCPMEVFGDVCLYNMTYERRTSSDWKILTLLKKSKAIPVTDREGP
jgi:hypothetical protein